MLETTKFDVKTAKEVTLQIMVDNKAKGKGIMSEHGLSLLLNLDGRLVLFDTGQGQVLGNNARTLGIDLRLIRSVILSHGHYDHSGGLVFWKDLYRAVDLYAHPDAFLERYVKDETKKIWECGIPFSPKHLEAFGFTLKLSREPQVLEPGVIISGEIPRIHPIPYPNFCCDHCGEWQEDTIHDDQFLLVSTPMGWVLVLGCNHADLVNTIDYAHKLNRGEKIAAMIGGMHIIETSQEKLEEKAEILKNAGIEVVIPLHCSGFPAMCVFKNKFKEKFIEGKTGMKLHFEENGIRIS